MGTMFRLNADSLSPTPGTRVLKAHEMSVLLEATALLDSAKERAAEIEARALKDAEKRKQEGYEQGLMQGRMEQTEKMMETTLQAVEYIEGMEEKLVQVVSTAVRKIIGELDDRERIVRVVRTGLNMVRNQQKVLIRVAPSDEDAVRDSLKVMLQKAPGSVSVMDVSADPRIAPGGCILESELGVVDASLETQLKALEHALNDRIKEH